MHFSTTLLGILSITTLTLALPTDSIPTANNVGDCSICTNTTLPDYYEAIHQGEFRLADILDRKDYNSLGLAMTQDAIYDNSALPGGSVMKGLEEIKAKVAQAFGNSLVRHDVTTGKIDALDPTKAHVIT
jgi:hypothetical protein